MLLHIYGAARQYTTFDTVLSDFTKTAENQKYPNLKSMAKV